MTQARTDDAPLGATELAAAFGLWVAKETEGKPAHTPEILAMIHRATGKEALDWWEDQLELGDELTGREERILAGLASIAATAETFAVALERRLKRLGIIGS